MPTKYPSLTICPALCYPPNPKAWEAEMAAKCAADKETWEEEMGKLKALHEEAVERAEYAEGLNGLLQKEVTW